MSGSTFVNQTRGSNTFARDEPVLQNLQLEIDSAARSTAKVLLTGETGVGKEVVARLIHERGERRNKPFVTINCAGGPDTSSSRSCSATRAAVSPMRIGTTRPAPPAQHGRSFSTKSAR
jgi:transcriptional regulator of acetoin/glycerol metabolism